MSTNISTVTLIHPTNHGGDSTPPIGAISVELNKLLAEANLQIGELNGMVQCHRLAQLKGRQLKICKPPDGMDPDSNIDFTIKLKSDDNNGWEGHINFPHNLSSKERRILHVHLYLASIGDYEALLDNALTKKLLGEFLSNFSKSKPVSKSQLTKFLLTLFDKLRVDMLIQSLATAEKLGGVQLRGSTYYRLTDIGREYFKILETTPHEQEMDNSDPIGIILNGSSSDGNKNVISNHVSLLKRVTRSVGEHEEIVKRLEFLDADEARLKQVIEDATSQLEAHSNERTSLLAQDEKLTNFIEQVERIGESISALTVTNT